MIYTLLQHQWKSFWRSRSAGRNVAMQIIIGFFVLYLSGVAIFLGFSLDKILSEVSHGHEVIPVFLGLILYYFSFDIIMRFIMQDLPTLAVLPYLTQNIRRNKLVRFLNVRSLFSIFIFLPLFIFLPFIISVIGGKYGSMISLVMVISIFSLAFFNHFLVLFIKRKTILSQWWLIGFFLAIILVILADYFQIFSLRNWSVSLFTFVIKVPTFCIVFLSMAIASWYNNSGFLRNNFYLENLEKSSGEKKSADYNWLQRFGTYGDLMAIDIKLILRNKRPRTLLLLSAIFLFYGFLFFKPEFVDKNRFGQLLLGSFIVTSMFMISYGQFVFAWQSLHFDGLMAGNNQIKTYIKSKLFLLIIFSTISFLLSLLYGFISWKLIPILIATWLFNIGIHAVLTCFIGTRSYKGIDLSKGATFNYQGIGAAQWLYSLIILVIGVAIYLPFVLLINAWSGIAALGILGLICFIMQDWWLDKIVIQFQKNKYKMLEGFREK
ncbi:MAG: DUF5687 family protein [Bacteroidota bacterium]|nr:DUF5687 family protein [Bacteroidota bacterium]